MAGKNGQVNIGAGTFPAGGKIGLHERVGDAKRGRAAETATIDKDGTANFSGLEPGKQYYVSGKGLSGRDVTVAATAKAPAPVSRPQRDPADVRNDLQDQALDQGSTNAPPVEGMRSSASVAPKSPDQAQRNRETMASAKRTADALRAKDLEGAQFDRTAAEGAGIQTRVGPSGDAQLLAGSDDDEAAKKRSAASKKAAATRRRNAAKRARSSKSKASSGSKRASGSKAAGKKK